MRLQFRYKRMTFFVDITFMPVSSEEPTVSSEEPSVSSEEMKTKAAARNFGNSAGRQNKPWIFRRNAICCTLLKQGGAVACKG